MGLASFLVVASPSEGSGVPDARQWVWAVGSRGMIVVVLLLLSRHGSPARRAALFGAATAVVWSVDAALHTGPGYVLGAVASLAGLGAGVVMLSIWAPPTMSADELARLRGRARPGEDVAPRPVPANPER